jgi:GAF domain-containing protein
MEATAPVSRSYTTNRRHRVRQKVHVPAYASFTGASQSEMLDLYEVLDISQNGIALQCSSRLEIDQTVELCLDLAETGAQISGTARVAWSDTAGHVGLELGVPAEAAQHQLSTWLFLNVLAAAANAGHVAAHSGDSLNSIHPQNYTDILSAASAVQREAESLGSKLEAVLSLVASRSQSLLHASGAAIALQGDKEEKEDAADAVMVCRASSGPGAPPVGITLHVGSGFSGECVRTGKLLRCVDTETDERVDRQTCRALGIRSMIAAPIRKGDEVVGLLEVFSLRSGAFGDNDAAVLQRLAETVQAALIRSARIKDPTAPPPLPPKPFSPPRGGVLFAHLPESGAEKDAPGEQDNLSGIRLPRGHLYLLFAAAATIFLALGVITEPWIHEKLQTRKRSDEQTVLASSHAPADATNSPASIPAADSANLTQLRELADHNDPAAENALGLIYAAGDEKQGIRRDETEAAHWFSKAAEHGNVPAQSKLGSLYWGGRGLSKDDAQAYFWTVLARANGDAASKALAPFIATRLTPAQKSAIEQKAEQWLERQESTSKPLAAR